MKVTVVSCKAKHSEVFLFFLVRIHSFKTFFFFAFSNSFFSKKPALFNAKEGSYQISKFWYCSFDRVTESMIH